MLLLLEYITRMTSYFQAFAWGIYIFLSFLGWGGIVNRLLFPKDRVVWGQRAAWGMAFTICVGGVLNVTWSISRLTLGLYLSIGVLFWLIDFLKNRQELIKSLSNFQNYRQDKVVIVGGIIILGLVFLKYAGWVYTRSFNLHDDFHAYLVFPHKMLEMGSLGEDPFSSRRIETGLGGQSFLHALTLTTLKEVNLNLIDPGISTVIAVGVILGYMKEKALSNRSAIFMVFLFISFPLCKVNIASTMIITALLISWVTFLDFDKLKSNNFIGNACIVALIFASLCTLKTSVIPLCGILFLFSYSCYIWTAKEQRKFAIYEFLIAGLLIFLLLLPWMISMYQSSGTLLYPIFGKGYHSSNYTGINYFYRKNENVIGIAIPILLQAMTQVYFLILLVLGFLSLKERKFTIRGREPVLCLFISTILITLILALATRGIDGITRYPIPMVNATLIVLVIDAFVQRKNQEKSKFSTPTAFLVAVCLSGVLMSQYAQSYPIENALDKNYGKLLHDIKMGLISKITLVSSVPPISRVSQSDIDQFYTMQQAIPEQETVFTVLDKPFLLDFKRNKIFIADLPGGASLPPGMPLFQGGEALSNYLLSKSIRYVAYSYGNEANYSKKIFAYRLNANFHPWLQTLSKYIFDVHDSLEELGKTRTKIYDDGERFVIDLLNHQP